MAHYQTQLDPATFATRARRCPDCAHPAYKHRQQGAPVNGGKLGDPTPCWTPISGWPDGPYEHCGCTTVLPEREGL